MARKQPDPIFTAIAAHREAHDEYRAEGYYLWAKRRIAPYAPEFKALTEAYEVQTDKLVTTHIATLAGVQAFAAYLGALQCCGTSEIAPCVYPVWLGQLSAGMDRIAECLARLGAAKAERRRPCSSRAALAEAA